MIPASRSLQGRALSALRGCAEAGRTASPKTGDEASPVLWTAAIVTTGAAMLGMAVCGKKQKRIRAK